MIDYKEDTDAAGDAIASTGGLGYLLTRNPTRQEMGWTQIAFGVLHFEK